jgi:hypothetical protein
MMEGTGYFETSVRTSDRAGNTRHCENTAFHTRRGLTAVQKSAAAIHGLGSTVHSDANNMACADASM